MLIQVVLLLAVAANPGTLTGKVVGVTDGDTLTLLVGNPKDRKYAASSGGAYLCW